MMVFKRPMTALETTIAYLHATNANLQTTKADVETTNTCHQTTKATFLYYPHILVHKKYTEMTTSTSKCIRNSLNKLLTFKNNRNFTCIGICKRWW